MSTERKNRKAFRAIFCLFIWILLSVLITALLVDVRNTSQMCFVLDIVRERVPERVAFETVEGSHAPFGMGSICFDETQRLAHWNITETFQHAYSDGVADVQLHGPLAEQSVAPAIMAMGVQRNSRSVLSGSSVISLGQLGSIVERPDQFYVAIYAKTRDRTEQVEVGRSKLMRPRLKR
jgi:hypothetical protein